MSLGSPLVSVLLPVRDAAPTLPACLSSLARQTWPDFEVVAVDDASTDGSRAILDRWASRDARFRSVPGRGRGLVPALETGRACCRGAFIARMDADDLAHPERLGAQLAHLQAQPNLAATGCRVRIFPRQRVRGGWARYESWLNRLLSPEDIYRERFVESPLAHPSVMIRAEALAEAGGYREGDFPEDHDLWLRILALGRRIDKVDRLLLAWRDSPTRHSRVHPRYAPECFRALKLAHLLSGPLRRRDRVAIWGAGRNGRRWAELLLSAGRRVSCFVDIDPKKIGRRPKGVSVVSAEEADLARLPFLLGAVAKPGARELIRERMRSAGRREVRDYLFVQ